MLLLNKYQSDIFFFEVQGIFAEKDLHTAVFTHFRRSGYEFHRKIQL
jgi:hypothetical protein